MKRYAAAVLALLAATVSAAAPQSGDAFAKLREIVEHQPDFRATVDFAVVEKDGKVVQSESSLRAKKGDAFRLEERRPHQGVVVFLDRPGADSAMIDVEARQYRRLADRYEEYLGDTYGFKIAFLMYASPGATAEEDGSERVSGYDTLRFVVKVPRSEGQIETWAVNVAPALGNLVVRIAEEDETSRRVTTLRDVSLEVPDELFVIPEGFADATPKRRYGYNRIDLPNDDGQSALGTPLDGTNSLAIDAAGNVIISDIHRRAVRRIDPSGVITTLAAGGLLEDLGNVEHSGPYSQIADVAADPAGNVFVANTATRRVVRVDASGKTVVYAGSGRLGYSGDGGPATRARTSCVRAAAADSAGNVYFADVCDPRIRKVDAKGIVTTVAGNGIEGESGDGGPALGASFTDPAAIAVDAAGIVYVAEKEASRIRRIDPQGIVTTLAGTGAAGYSGDGGPAAAARLNKPWGLAVDGSGNLFVADSGNHAIRRIDQNGVITTVAGNGEKGFGENVPARTSSLATPTAVAVAADGRLFVFDLENERICTVDAEGKMLTFAGRTRTARGDGGPATAAVLEGPAAVAFEPDGAMLVLESTPGRLRRVDASGVIRTVPLMRRGTAPGSGEVLLEMRLQYPSGLAVDASGNIYVSDTGNDVVWRLDRKGRVSRFAGTGEEGYSGDGGPAAAAKLSAPSDLVFDAGGNLYVADHGSDVVRRVAPNGTISTVAGGPKQKVRLETASGLAVDASGNLFVADARQGRVWRFDRRGRATCIAGNGEWGDAGDGGRATSAEIGDPFRLPIAADRDGNVYLASGSPARIRVVTPDGMIRALGPVDWRSAGAGEPPRIPFDTPAALAIAPDGSLVVVDWTGDRVVKIDRRGACVPLAGRGDDSAHGAASGGDRVDPQR